MWAALPKSAAGTPRSNSMSFFRISPVIFWAIGRFQHHLWGKVYHYCNPLQLAAPGRDVSGEVHPCQLAEWPQPNCESASRAAGAGPHPSGL